MDAIDRGIVSRIGDAGAGGLLNADIIKAVEGITQTGVGRVAAETNGQLAGAALDALGPGRLGVKGPSSDPFFEPGTQGPQLLILLANANVAAGTAQAGHRQRVGADRRDGTAREGQIEQMAVLGVGETVIGAVDIEFGEAVRAVFDRTARAITLAGDDVITEG